MTRILVIIFVVLSSLLARASTLSVRAAVPEGLPPPLLFSKEEELTGIVPEYTRAIIEALGRPGNLVHYPRNRLSKYLHRGDVDFNCYTSPMWADEKETFNWSETLFFKKEYIFGPAPMPKDIKKLEGKILGTKADYKYPKLEKMFRENHIHREDGPSEEANFIKLRDKHIEYLIVDEILLVYYKQLNPEIEKGRERMLLEEYPVACALSKKGRVTIEELNKAIKKVKASGKLQAIFGKYGMAVNE